MNWRIKGIVQKILSHAPGGMMLNDLLQRHAGDLRNFEDHVRRKLVDWEILVSHSSQLGMPIAGTRLAEIGTGWFPTLPLCYALAGARSCETFDLTRHMHAGLTFRMLAALEPHLELIGRASGRPLDAVRHHYATLRNAPALEQLLQSAAIHYHAPGDATQTRLPDNSVDIVFSNSVFEHVPPQTIRAMLAESHRILRLGGLSIHSANCGDHYAYFDRSITAINYLTYTARDWDFWDNKLLYQNRLRPSDFLDMARQAGLEIALAYHKPKPHLIAALPKLEISQEFRQYPPEQLCATSVDFVGRRAG